jgi:hypothetical protein
VPSGRRTRIGFEVGRMLVLGWLRAKNWPVVPVSAMMDDVAGGGDRMEE